MAGQMRKTVQPACEMHATRFSHQHEGIPSPAGRRPLAPHIVEGLHLGAGFCSKASTPVESSGRNRNAGTLLSYSSTVQLSSSSCHRGFRRSSCRNPMLVAQWRRFLNRMGASERWTRGALAFFFFKIRSVRGGVTNSTLMRSRPALL